MSILPIVPDWNNDYSRPEEGLLLHHYVKHPAPNSVY
jgi:hypothetical protein